MEFKIPITSWVIWGEPILTVVEGTEVANTSPGHKSDILHFKYSDDMNLTCMTGKLSTYVAGSVAVLGDVFALVITGIIALT